MEIHKYPTMTRTQLAQQYQVCLPTFNRMLSMIPDFTYDKNLRTLTPKQVGLIYQHLGEPPD
ncbi:hypothetical protein LV89_01027 [Arcicella aurantiaca]|uniref:DUF4248 domain-containing protein n=2 Tax=Arcicella aurantiaca TaxID=591202 RepID=A0A316EDM5_9BACT|nr:hypothetical protein LV89_01027 [Arcicella aurantiaca]